MALKLAEALDPDELEIETEAKAEHFSDFHSRWES
jgi:hypothetical protein